MPSAQVIQAFKCKHFDARYLPGMTYTHDDVSRVEFLRDSGYVFFVSEPAETNEAPVLKKTKKPKG
jgi:hypothetical protein